MKKTLPVLLFICGYLVNGFIFALIVFAQTSTYSMPTDLPNIIRMLVLGPLSPVIIIFLCPGSYDAVAGIVFGVIGVFVQIAYFAGLVFLIKKIFGIKKKIA
jgi:hypothetical protein